MIRKRRGDDQPGHQVGGGGLVVTAVHDLAEPVVPTVGRFEMNAQATESIESVEIRPGPRAQRDLAPDDAKGPNLVRCAGVIEDGLDTGVANVDDDAIASRRRLKTGSWGHRSP